MHARKKLSNDVPLMKSNDVPIKICLKVFIMLF